MKFNFITFAKKTALIFGTTLLLALPSHAKRVALVIGNDNYASVTKLQKAGNDATAMAKAIVEKPVMIIAHTIPGKGVDFMEYDFHWHGKAPNHDEEVKALNELRTLGGKIRSEHE